MNEDNLLDIEQSSAVVTDDNISSETDIENDNVSIEETTIVYEYPEYTESNPLPVYVIDEVIPEVSIFAETNVYYGTISDTYLNYFEGIVEKLPHDSHYLVWRSGAYSYTMAYGEDLEMVGSVVRGHCDIVQLYRDNDYNSNWYVSNLSDTIEIETITLFAYSDLGNLPTLERGIDTITGNTILFAICFFVVYGVLHDILDHAYNLFNLRR